MLQDGFVIMVVSIHARPRAGDANIANTPPSFDGFNTPPPASGRPHSCFRAPTRPPVSIPARPRAGDHVQNTKDSPCNVSIHARPRAGDDWVGIAAETVSVFQSTPARE